jgi:hypothetical protein
MMPLLKEELITSMKDKMMIRSCQKILKNLLSFNRKRLVDGKTFELSSIWRMPWSSAILKTSTSSTSLTAQILQIKLD